MHTIGDTLSQSNRGHLNLFLETATPTPEFPLEELTEQEKLLLFFKFYDPADGEPEVRGPPTPGGWATSHPRRGGPGRARAGWKA